MSDKTEAQIEREKQAVLAMSNAKSNMATALDRIDTLNRSLRSANQALSYLKHHVGGHSYIRDGSNHRTVTEWIDELRAAIAKVL